MKKAIITAIALTLSFLSGAAALAPAPVYAEGEEEQSKPAIQLQLAPVSNRVTLNPGSSQEYSFSVSNTGTDEFVYKVYTAPYSVTGEDYDINFSSETNRTQISRWIQFKNGDGEWSDSASFTLPAGEK